MAAQRHCAGPAPHPDTSRKRANPTFCTEKSYMLPSGRPASLRNRCNKPAHSGHGLATRRPRPAANPQPFGPIVPPSCPGHTRLAHLAQPLSPDLTMRPHLGSIQCVPSLESVSRLALHRCIAPRRSSMTPKMHQNGAKHSTPVPLGQRRTAPYLPPDTCQLDAFLPAPAPTQPGTPGPMTARPVSGSVQLRPVHPVHRAHPRRRFGPMVLSTFFGQEDLQ